MHESSFEKMRAFRDAYVASTMPRPIRVLDVGSGSEEGMLSYRDLFGPPDFDYVGLDIDTGYNVDTVVEDPFSWSSLASESFDLVVSGQTFEHNPYFWITAAEIARVLVPGGLAAIIAPSKGHVHRFPLDCWRFYPDSWSAVCTYVGLELVEAFTEPPSWRLVIPGVYWGDAMMVARRPVLAESDEESFSKRLEAIVATRTLMPTPSPGPGRAGREYEETHVLPLSAMARHPAFVVKRLNPHVRRRWPFNRIRQAAVRANARRALARGAARS